MRTDHCRMAHLLEEHRALFYLAYMQPSSRRGKCDKNVRGGGGGVSNNEKLLYRNLWYNPTYLLGDFLVSNVEFLNSCQNHKTQGFQFNRQTPSSRELTAKFILCTLYLIESTHMSKF